MLCTVSDSKFSSTLACINSANGFQEFYDFPLLVIITELCQDAYIYFFCRMLHCSLGKMISNTIILLLSIFPRTFPTFTNTGKIQTTLYTCSLADKTKASQLFTMYSIIL